jgi:hypothetical protein
VVLVEIQVILRGFIAHMSKKMREGRGEEEESHASLNSAAILLPWASYSPRSHRGQSAAASLASSTSESRNKTTRHGRPHLQGRHQGVLEAPGLLPHGRRRRAAPPAAPHRGARKWRLPGPGPGPAAGGGWLGPAPPVPRVARAPRPAGAAAAPRAVPSPVAHAAPRRVRVRHAAAGLLPRRRVRRRRALLRHGDPRRGGGGGLRAAGAAQGVRREGAGGDLQVHTRARRASRRRACRRHAAATDGCLSLSGRRDVCSSCLFLFLCVATCTEL